MSGNRINRAGRGRKGPRGGRMAENNVQREIRGKIKKEQEMILKGCRIFLPSMPPEFTTNPWNQLTVSIGALTVVTVDSVVETLKTQLNIDLPELQTVVVRIHSVRIWAPLVGFNVAIPLSPLTATFFDLISPFTSDAAQPVLEQFRDFPDQVRRAAIGFVWPLAQQAQALAGGTRQICRISPTGATATNPNVVYVRLWWRPRPPASPINKDEIEEPPGSSTNSYQGMLGEFEVLNIGGNRNE
jgi:hypothetical protein